MTKKRDEIPEKERWNVALLYSSWGDWEADLALWEKGANVQKIGGYKGKLGDGPELVKELLDLTFSLDRHLSKLYTYAHLRHDEDVAEERAKQAFMRIGSLGNTFRQEISWVEPEILGLDESYFRAEILSPYHIYLHKVIRSKPHLLSAEKEELCSLAAKGFETAYRAFGAFNNADLKFPLIEDGKGEMRELTHGKYLLYLRDVDRVLRERAFKTLNRSFGAYENTVCELINGQLQTHLFEKKARNYKSCLEAALFPHQIDSEVYSSLIRAVRKKLPALHRYMALRKDLLGVSELHLYDMHVPLVSQVDLSMSYEKAERLVIDSLTPLGKEYQDDLEKGLLQERWVDRYENANKRSGAYSSGCYDSIPYILMNYQGTFNDVKTLTHEAGHSMHSRLSNRNQAYPYAQYPIFVAEVASTFHEQLLVGHLQKLLTKPEEKAYLINQEIEDIRSTFFRQTMFAEFELKIHEFVEQDIPLTPGLLKAEYRKLNQDYFGPDVVIDEEADWEWARIPHFYYNFYVYQYATGLSAAHTLVKKVLEEGESARHKYLQFLSSGNSRYPLELLQLAGVDMKKGEAVELLIDHFENLVTELKKVLR